MLDCVIFSNGDHLGVFMFRWVQNKLIGVGLHSFAAIVLALTLTHCSKISVPEALGGNGGHGQGFNPAQSTEEEEKLAATPSSSLGVLPPLTTQASESSAQPGDDELVSEELPPASGQGGFQRLPKLKSQ